MSDDHNGRAAIPGQRDESADRRRRRRRVQVLCRLISKDELRSVDQRSGDASPLQLATGNLVRKAVGQGVDPKLGEKPHDLAAVVAGPTWRTDQAQRQRNVLKEGQFGQELIGLEDHPAHSAPIP